MTPSLQGLSIFLIGMMGSGKSTVGRALAHRLNYRFFDSDILIERVAQQTLIEIFQSQGEAAFRAIETEVLRELAACLRSVVATGGGAVLEQTNWSHLRQGLIVWLDAPVDLLVQRLQQDQSRPLLQEGDLMSKLTTLLEQRHGLYREADLIIALQAGSTPEQIAELILEKIPSVLKSKAEDWRQNN
jgi:shikimate kinase